MRQSPDCASMAVRSSAAAAWVMAVRAAMVPELSIVNGSPPSAEPNPATSMATAGPDVVDALSEPVLVKV